MFLVGTSDFYKTIRRLKKTQKYLHIPMVEPYFENRSMEGLVYLLFMQERTQKEASEFIYDKEYDRINLQTFRNARKQLVEDGYLEVGDSQRNTDYKSKVGPLVQKTNEKFQKHHEGGLTDDQKQALRMIYDSDWFRSFFSLDKIDKLYHIKRKDDSNRLTYSTTAGALKAIGQVLRDVSGLSTRIHPIRNYRGTSLEDLNEYDSFDDYLDDTRWFLKDIEAYVECWKEALRTQDINPFSERISRHEVFEIVCEGHNISEEGFGTGDVGNDLKMVFNLIYETDLLFKLPDVSKYGVPGRNHSKYYVMSSNLRSRIKEVYLLNDSFEEDMRSVLDEGETIFSNEERLQEILDSMESNGYEIDDRKEIIDFLQNYQEYGLPYLD